MKPAGAYKLVAFMVGKIWEGGTRSIVKAKGTDSLTETTAIRDWSYVRFWYRCYRTEKVLLGVATQVG